jgi:hypothetical protein
MKPAIRTAQRQCTLHLERGQRRRHAATRERLIVQAHREGEHGRGIPQIVDAAPAKRPASTGRSVMETTSSEREFSTDRE